MDSELRQLLRCTDPELLNKLKRAGLLRETTCCDWCEAAPFRHNGVEITNPHLDSNGCHEVEPHEEYGHKVFPIVVTIDNGMTFRFPTPERAEEFCISLVNHATCHFSVGYNNVEFCI